MWMACLHLQQCWAGCLACHPDTALVDFHCLPNPQDKAIWSAHLDKASHEISRMTDSWWITARDFDIKLEQRGKLVQVRHIATI